MHTRARDGGVSFSTALLSAGYRFYGLAGPADKGAAQDDVGVYWRPEVFELLAAQDVGEESARGGLLTVVSGV